MRIIRDLDRARDVAARWRDQYRRADGTWTYTSSDSEVIYEEILALGVTPMPSDVEHIIGNSSWTTVECDECLEAGMDAVVELNELSEHPVKLCLGCANKVLVYLKAAQQAL